MYSYLFVSLLNSAYISIDDPHLNEPQDITVTLSEEVDLEQSSFYVNDELFVLENAQFEIFIDQENESILRYVLKDRDGKVLEESSTIITLDTKNPDIDISSEGLFEDVIYFKEKESLTIHINDEHLESSEIYVDDVLISSQDESVIDIHSGNHSIRVIASDEFGHSTEKNIVLHEVKEIGGRINVEYDAYILDPHVKLEFDQTVDEFLDLVVLLDGKEISRKSCKDVDLIDLLLEQSGDITLKLVHQFVPIELPLFGYDQYIFHFSQEELVLNMRCDSYYANENVFVHIDYDPRYIKTSQLEIWNGEVWIHRDIIDEIVFAAIPGQSIDYYARAVIEDKFSRVVEKEVFVTVDKKAPEINLFKGTIPLSDAEPNRLNKSDVLSFQVDEEADVEIKILKNNSVLSVPDLM